MYPSPDRAYQRLGAQGSRRRRRRDEGTLTTLVPGSESARPRLAAAARSRVEHAVRSRAPASAASSNSRGLISMRMPPQVDRRGARGRQAPALPALQQRVAARRRRTASMRARSSEELERLDHVVVRAQAQALHALPSTALRAVTKMTGVVIAARRAGVSSTSQPELCGQHHVEQQEVEGVRPGARARRDRRPAPRSRQVSTRWPLSCETALHEAAELRIVVDEQELHVWRETTDGCVGWHAHGDTLVTTRADHHRWRGTVRSPRCRDPFGRGPGATIPFAGLPTSRCPRHRATGIPARAAPPRASRSAGDSSGCSSVLP